LGVVESVVTVVPFGLVKPGAKYTDIEATPTITKIPTASTPTKAEIPFREDLNAKADALRLGPDFSPGFLTFNSRSPRKLGKPGVG